VHQLVCFDAGGSSGQQQLGAAPSAGKKSRGDDGHRWEVESGAATTGAEK
jgi:hypothetical protein